MATTVFLGLGSNVGDRNENIRQALASLESIGISIEKIASIIETDPVGGPPQPKYLNTVLKAKTSLSASALLKKIKTIETLLGRTPSAPNAPRPIDIDILLYGRRHITTPQLVIPHPRMKDRDFVMKPLLEIEPSARKIFAL